MEMNVITGGIPKYRQLLQLLRHQILSSQFTAGARLPTEEELVQRYGLSKGTVRKAIEQLSAEGLVRTEQGSGSYVNAGHPNALPIHFIHCPSSATTRFEIVTREVIPASFMIAERLKVPIGEPLIHIAQLCYNDQQIVGYSERFLPRSLCPDLLEEDLTQVSIHETLVRRSELPLLRAVMEVEAQMLASQDANLLHVAPGTSALVITRTTYTAPNRPAVWYRGLYQQAYLVGFEVDVLEVDEKNLKGVD